MASLDELFQLATTASDVEARAALERAEQATASLEGPTRLRWRIKLALAHASLNTLARQSAWTELRQQGAKVLQASAPLKAGYPELLRAARSPTGVSRAELVNLAACGAKLSERHLSRLALRAPATVSRAP